MTTRGVFAKWIYFLLPYLMELCSQHSWLPVLFIFFALSVSISLYIPQERWNKWLTWLLSCPPLLSPFMPYTTGISSWLVYTVWKLAWHSLNIANKLSVCIDMLTYFLVGVCMFCVFFFFCPPQVNQVNQNKVDPYKKVHLTVQAFWRVFPFPWSKSLSRWWEETFLVPYLIKSTVHCSVLWYLSPGTHLSLLKPEE